jgi:site-specific DNA recombinase
MVRTGAAQAQGAAQDEPGLYVLTYKRVSSEEQRRGGVSLPAQTRETQRYAARLGGQVENFVDVQSAWQPDSIRPEYDALLRRAWRLRAAGQAVKVVVSMRDRFGRRVEERCETFDKLATLGVEVHSVREGGLIDAETNRELAEEAEKESAKLSGRISSTWREVRMLGWWKVSSMLPWGYRARPATEAERDEGSPLTVIEPDPDAASAVRQAFERVAAGQSMRQVARWTSALPAEVRGYRYNDGRPGSNREARRIERVADINMLKHVLGNPVYVGCLDVDGQQFPGRWRPIVDADLWDRVQARLAQHRQAPRARPESYLLTGLLKCPQCPDSPMAGSMQRTSPRNTRRYRCGSNRQRTAAGKCNYTVDANQVETLVLTQMRAVIESWPSGWAEGAVAEASEAVVGLRRDIERRAKLRQQVDEVRLAIQTLSTQMARGRIGMDQFFEQSGELKATLDMAETALARIPEPDARLVENLDWSLQQHPEALLATLDGTDGQAKHDLLRRFIERVTPSRVKWGQYRVDITWLPIVKLIQEGINLDDVVPQQA